MKENKSQQPPSCASLPADYHEIEKIDLAGNKKLFWLINGSALIIMVVMFFLGFLIEPRGASPTDLFRPFSHALLTAGGYLLYIVAHEWVHGLVMKHYFPDQVHYGFSLSYAYAGSDAFYNKHDYQIIALAPVVVWGIVLLVLQLIVPADLWWCVYFIQMGNIAGAMGDYYVFFRFTRLPDTVLVRDTGVEMTVFEPVK